jgi:large subunit ribosomal protein L25
MPPLNAELRDPEVARNLKQLRRTGVLPMAIIEKGKGTILIQAAEKEVKEVLRHAGPLRQFEIKLGDEAKPRNVILKAVDKDYIHNRLLHIAVLQVNETDVVELEIPVRFEGIPEIVAKQEATLIHVTDRIEVRGRLMDLPDEILVQVGNLQLNESISVSDLTFPENLEVVTSPEATIAAVRPLKIELEPEIPVVPVEGEEGAVEGAEGAEGEAPAAEGAEGAPAKGEAPKPEAGKAKPEAGKAKPEGSKAKPEVGKKGE